MTNSLHPIMRAARKKIGLTLTQLSKISGVSQSHLTYLETGKRNFTKEQAERIAPHLGLTAIELLFGEKGSKILENESLLKETSLSDPRPVEHCAKFAGMLALGLWVDDNAYQSAEYPDIPVFPRETDEETAIFLYSIAIDAHVAGVGIKKDTKVIYKQITSPLESLPHIASVIVQREDSFGKKETTVRNMVRSGEKVSFETLPERDEDTSTFVVTDLKSQIDEFGHKVTVIGEVRAIQIDVPSVLRK